MRTILLLAVLGLFAPSVNAQVSQETVPVPGTVQRVLENRDDWQNAMVRSVQRYFRTPHEMRESGPWGIFEVKIAFEVAPDGQVSGVSVAESSGIIDVDVFAVSGFNQAMLAKPLASFTPDMGNEPMKYILPITLDNPERTQTENGKAPAALKLETGDPAG